MPRTTTPAPDHDRKRSLGGLAVAWMEYFVRHGPGDVQGQRIYHGDEYFGFVLDCYALGDDAHNAHMLYDSGFFSRPKGSDKSGLGARIALFEALGPARFAGWAKGGEVYRDPWGMGFKYVYRPGEPMGKPVTTPMIRCMATEETQPLALDTPVPTPSGWTTIGKLKVGDQVFAADGRPVKVARQTRVMRDLDCYAATFTGGERVVASASHLWTMQRRRGKGDFFETVTVTTEELAATYLSPSGGSRYRVPAGVSWELPEQALDVDPYLLGLWLGDGSAGDAGIALDWKTAGEQVAIVKKLLLPHEEIAPLEYKNERVARFRIRRRKGVCPWGHEYGDDVRFRSCGPCRRGEPRGARCDSFRERLRNLGVLGNKHIPAHYLRASVDQRWSLLQGLIDSDGNVNSTKGRAFFVNTNRGLIDGACELLTSLGFKWDLQEQSATNSWRVGFQPSADRPVARLLHKVAQHRTASKNPRSARRHVVKVERVPSVPVRCIGIDTDDHLFLVGRQAVPTHNTGNVYSTIYFNLTEDECPLAHVPGVDAGVEKVLLPQGGEIRVSTASSASKDGGKETFTVFDAGPPAAPAVGGPVSNTPT